MNSLTERELKGGKMRHEEKTKLVQKKKKADKPGKGKVQVSSM